MVTRSAVCPVHNYCWRVGGWADILFVKGYVATLHGSERTFATWNLMPKVVTKRTHVRAGPLRRSRRIAERNLKKGTETKVFREAYDMRNDAESNAAQAFLAERNSSPVVSSHTIVVELGEAEPSIDIELVLLDPRADGTRPLILVTTKGVDHHQGLKLGGDIVVTVPSPHFPHLGEALETTTRRYPFSVTHEGHMDTTNSMIRCGGTDFLHSVWHLDLGCASSDDDPDAESLAKHIDIKVSSVELL